MKKFLLTLLIAAILVLVVKKYFFGAEISVDFEKVTDSSLRNAVNFCQQVKFLPSQAKCLATITKDESFCQKVIFPWEKTECLALATQDSSYCEKLALNAKRRCFSALAELTKNPFLCDQGTRENPDCYEDFSLGYRRKTYCDEITSVKEGPIFLCRALVERDRTGCQRIQSEEKVLCESVLGRNADGCEMLSEETRDDCYDKVAIEKGDKYLCEMVADKKARQDCFIGVAEATRDATICEEQSFFVRDRCYFELAKVTSENLNLYLPIGY